MTGQDTGYEPDLTPLHFTSVCASAQFLGTPLFFPVSFFVFGQAWESGDLHIKVPGLVLAFLLMPTLIMAGWYLGGLLAVALYPRWHTAEEAARSVLFALRAMPPGTFRKKKKLRMIRMYERILTWRFDEPVTLAR